MINTDCCLGLGGRVPDDMKAQLERIITSGVTVPSLMHYLRYAFCQCIRDTSGC